MVPIYEIRYAILCNFTQFGIQLHILLSFWINFLMTIRNEFMKRFEGIDYFGCNTIKIGTVSRATYSYF